MGDVRKRGGAVGGVITGVIGGVLVVFSVGFWTHGDVIGKIRCGPVVLLVPTSFWQVTLFPILSVFKRTITHAS